MRSKYLLLLILVMLTCLVSNGSATIIKAENDIRIQNDKPVNDDIIAAGNKVSIESGVNGDVTAAGQTIDISGSIKDSVTAAGNGVTVSGPVGNDAWLAGNTVDASSRIADNAYMAGGTVDVTDQASITKDLYVAGGTITVDGTVGRNLRASGGEFTIDGTVNGNVYADASSVKIGKNAVIRGNLFYKSPGKADIASGAKILGETRHTLPPKERAKPMFWSKLLRWVLSLIAAFVFGAVLISIFPSNVGEAASTIQRSFWLSLLIGLLEFILVPFIVIILAITVIGIPLAVALAFIYLILLYAAVIFSAIALGNLVMSRWPGRRSTLTTSLILGLIILWLIFLIPYFGGIVKFFAMIAGLGGFIMGWWRMREHRGEASITQPVQPAGPTTENHQA